MSALLSLNDAELFFRLHRSLLYYVNEQLGIVPDVGDPDEFSGLPPEVRWEVRNAFVERPDLIEPFVDENPFGMSDEELQIIRSWRDHVAGRFFIFRHLKKYTVFLDYGDPPTAYGVLALSESFEDIISLPVPVWVETVLLPFQDKIIYDGLMNSFNIVLGGGIKRSLNESYKRAKEEMGGVLTSLPT